MNAFWGARLTFLSSVHGLVRDGVKRMLRIRVFETGGELVEIFKNKSIASLSVKFNKAIDLHQPIADIAIIIRIIRG